MRIPWLRSAHVLASGLRNMRPEYFLGGWAVESFGGEALRKRQGHIIMLFVMETNQEQ